MQFRRVLDLTVTLLVEVYREVGMKFSDIMIELNRYMQKGTAERGPAGATSPPPPTPQQDAESFALLQAMMAGTDWKGR
jgi:hypothetical protein